MLYLSLRIVRFLLPVVPCLVLSPLPVLCQDSSNEKMFPRGDRAELSITLRDSAGEAITAPASVKLYFNGTRTDQTLAVRGRAFFIPGSGHVYAGRGRNGIQIHTKGRDGASRHEI